MELDETLTLLGGIRGVLRSMHETAYDLQLGIQESGVLNNQRGVNLYFRETPAIYLKLLSVLDLAIAQLSPWCVDMIPVGDLLGILSTPELVDPNEVVLDWIDPSRERS